jgi:hypothetical protein
MGYFEFIITSFVLFVSYVFFVPILTILMSTHRLLALVANKLEVHGEIDLDAFVKNAQQASGTGEGLADALDVGGAAGIEVGL